MAFSSASESLVLATALDYWQPRAALLLSVGSTMVLLQPSEKLAHSSVLGVRPSILKGNPSNDTFNCIAFPPMIDGL
jgi:hypothetical protein